MNKLTTQGNFYPMPSYMFLQDTTSRVTLLTGQPLGVSSRETGIPQHHVTTDHFCGQVAEKGSDYLTIDFWIGTT